MLLNVRRSRLHGISPLEREVVRESAKAPAESSAKGTKGRPGAIAIAPSMPDAIPIDRIDDSLAYFISEWRQNNGYDPREKGS